LVNTSLIIVEKIYFLKVINKQFEEDHTVERINRIKNSSFTLFNEAYFKKYGKNLDENFLYLFIGFAEGDGCISTFPKGNQVRFIITQKEKYILELIQKELGFGNIYFVDTGHGHYRYVVADKGIYYY
jgi:LAGLIDADG endonuclease